MTARTGVSHVERTGRPAGRMFGSWWIVSFPVSGVSGTAVPRAAGTRQSGPGRYAWLVPSTIVSSGAQAARENGPLSLTFDTPRPSTDSFMTDLSVKKPIHLPSGDTNGENPPPVFGTGSGSIAFIRRRNREGADCPGSCAV